MISRSFVGWLDAPARSLCNRATRGGAATILPGARLAHSLDRGVSP